MITGSQMITTHSVTFENHNMEIRAVADLPAEELEELLGMIMSYGILPDRIKEYQAMLFERSPDQVRYVIAQMILESWLNGYTQAKNYGISSKDIAEFVFGK